MAVEQAKSKKDAAVGSFLGACIGDAAGAVLEFMGHTPTPHDVERALGMPGGGIWGVAPGQITDDCELGLCLADALAQSATFGLERIARSYARWIASKPFDIGTTTVKALGCFTQPPWRDKVETEGYAAAMTDAAARSCMSSKSNGSLMRASPLGIWGHRFATEDLAEFARLDSSLSHPNPSCWQAVACYVIAIAHLINHPGDRGGAFDEAARWATCHANEEVRSWLDDAQGNVVVGFETQIGFVRIGFIHAFRHLHRGTAYVEAVRETLAGGGDTDTNACIVGGLLGAACGGDAIPLALRQAVLDCDPTQGQERPPFLHAHRVTDLVAKMMSF